jgi:outer membrane immunogenic protein
VAWTEGHVVTDQGVTFDVSRHAVFTGGGQVGANYQWSWFVLGVEADFDWLANNNNSSNTFSSAGHAFQFSSNDRWVTTVTGRVGYAFDIPVGPWGWGWNPGSGGNWLLYAKGGWGWAGVNNPTLTDLTTNNSLSVSNSNSNDGPVGGVGIEWAFAPNWTAKLEYDKLFLNNQNFATPITDFCCHVSTSGRGVNTVTVGVNYLFNWH